MTNKININQTLFKIIEDHPEIRTKLIEMGFTPIANEQMLQTAGRMMPLAKGAKQIGLPVDELIAKLEALGYEVEE